MEPAGLRAARHDGRRDPEHDAVRRAPRSLRGRRHVRHQLRVRLRLSPRQHGCLQGRPRPAQPLLRDRRRGRLDPDRRGAHAADHLGRARDRGDDLLRLRPDRQGARGRPRHAQGRQGGGRDRALRRRLPLRREAQDGLAGADRDRHGRARARDREPLRPAQRPARQPPDPVAEGAVAVPARRGLRDPGRRGEDRRRVHRPDHGGAPLERGPAPGRRGEGGRPDPGGEPDARDDHAPELLPALREARRHDRYREDRGEGVRRDLQPARGRDPHERAGRAARRERLHLQDEGSQVQGGPRRHQGALREGAARARRHDRRRDLRVPLRAAEAPRRPAQRPQCEGARARVRDHQGRGPAGRGHDRDEHGRPRCRHQAR